MPLQPFILERYFAQHEFKVRHLLSASDCETVTQAELLALADAETAALWAGLSLGYTESQGHPLLRAEIARQYAGSAADQVVVAAPEEAIFIAMHALLAPGDEVIVTWPAYQSLHEIARAIGARVIRWPLVAHAGAWHLDIADLERLLTPRARLVIVNFPHNPTGYLPTPAEFRAIIECVAARGIVLFSDEMYRGLTYAPEDRLPAACDLYERAVSLSGLSKAHGLPGLRIGWLATRAPEILARGIELKDYTTICSSAPSEILALIALRAAEALIARNQAIVRDNLARVDAFFAAHPDQFEWLRPTAGSVAFPRWRGAGTVTQLAETLLDRYGCMLVTAAHFGATGEHFRLGLGRRSFPAALAALARAIR